MLSRYYQGSTTLQEEQLLMEYFTTQTDIPEHLSSDREIFIALSETQNSEPEGLDSLGTKISATIASLALQEQKPKANRYRRYFIGIAASVAILLGIGAYFSIDSPHRNEITDLHLAYNETERALTLISEGLNKANSGLSQTQDKINNINRSINSILK